jgi:hypothetical protein
MRLTLSSNSERLRRDGSHIEQRKDNPLTNLQGLAPTIVFGLVFEMHYRWQAFLVSRSQVGTAVASRIARGRSFSGQSSMLCGSSLFFAYSSITR